MLFYEPLLAEVALQHHERWAGHGYPRGLRDEQIHPLAQIVGLADVFDAVTSDRVYRPAVSCTNALELIAGSWDFDFGIRYVEAFFECVAVYPVGTPVYLNVGGHSGSHGKPSRLSLPPPRTPALRRPGSTH